MNLGSVVTVCTNFLKGTHLISLRNTAKIMGNHENSKLIPLIANVFLITPSSCLIFTSFSNMDLNHLRPTKFFHSSGNGGL